MVSGELRGAHHPKIIHCSAIQKDSMKHCDTKIIVRKIVRGIFSPSYDGLWFDLKGMHQPVTSYGFV
jgi:hypothetical protein